MLFVFLNYHRHDKYMHMAPFLCLLAYDNVEFSQVRVLSHAPLLIAAASSYVHVPCVPFVLV